MTMRRSIHIEAPVESVFDTIMDTYRDPEKYRDLSPGGDIQYDDTKATKDGVGTYMSWHAKVAGLPMRGFDVVTDVTPPSHISERSSNAIVGRWDCEIEPEGSGTKLTFEHEPDSFWRLPLLHHVVDLATDRMSDRYLSNLKQRIEAERG